MEATCSAEKGVGLGAERQGGSKSHALAEVQ